MCTSCVIIARGLEDQRHGSSKNSCLDGSVYLFEVLQIKRHIAAKRQFPELFGPESQVASTSKLNSNLYSLNSFHPSCHLSVPYLLLLFTVGELCVKRPQCLQYKSSRCVSTQRFFQRSIPPLPYSGRRERTMRRKMLHQRR